MKSSHRTAVINKFWFNEMYTSNTHICASDKTFIHNFVCPHCRLFADSSVAHSTLLLQNNDH